MSNLIEVPAGSRPGQVFHITISDGSTLPISCPDDARVGDVLEIDLPPGTRLAGQDFLTRLGHAEVRDAKQQRAQRPAQHLRRRDDVLGGVLRYDMRHRVVIDSSARPINECGKKWLASLPL